MKNQITTHYRNCEACQVQSPSKPRQVPVLPDDLTKMAVMELVGVDLMQLGGKSYLVMVEKKSGYRFCTHLNKTSTKDVTSALEHWFFQFGIPSRLRSEGGPQFRQEFTRWCKELGIRHELSSAFNPESNGLCERGVGVIKECL